MELEYKLTRQQAEEEMRQYRKIFTVVRLLKADEIGRMIEEPEHHAVDEPCRCYSFWAKHSHAKTVFPQSLSRKRHRSANGNSWMTISIR